MTTPAAPSDRSLPDPGAVANWLVQFRPQLRLPLDITLITGGRSNLTYLLTDAVGPQWVLRRPPLSGVIASAHDVLREYRVMHALAGTGIPVPTMVAECGDLEVIGAPFFVMDYVSGVVLRDQDTAERELPETGRAHVGDSIIDTLAELHRLGPSDVGLAELGKGHGYITRQLARWELQLERLGIPASAGMHGVLTRLQAGVPEQKEVTIVHGDFRPGNTIVGADGQVLALLDWELATLGDPLADLGWLMAYWGSPDEAPLPLSVPTRASGFARPERLVERYAESTGRSVDDLGFYIAFALWRLAAIIAGVNARVRQHAYGSGQPADDPSADQRVEQLTAAAAAAASAAGR
jgi:aminoglycoside phosphotransferase (APT) family kinase protein